MQKAGVKMPPARRTTDAEPLIAFSSKELFLEINRKIDDLTKLSQSKVDSPDFDRLEMKVNEMQRLGSDTAQDAIRQIGTTRKDLERLEGDVRQLEKDNVSGVAVTNLNNLNRSTRLQWIGIVATMAFALADLFVILLKH
jgi:hypothetical protein